MLISGVKVIVGLQSVSVWSHICIFSSGVCSAGCCARF